MRTMLAEEEVFRRVIRPSPRKTNMTRKLPETSPKKPSQESRGNKKDNRTESKGSKYEVTRDSLGSSDSRHRKMPVATNSKSKDCGKKLTRKVSATSIELEEDTSGMAFTEITDLSRIPPSHGNTPRPPSSEMLLPPIGKSRSRSLSPDTAAAIQDKFSDKQGSRTVRKKKQPMSIASQAERTGSGKGSVKSTKRVPVSSQKPGTVRRTGATVPPSSTDYDFLRRALSDEKQPFLPAPSQRRGRSNSLPCESADITSLSVHLKNLAEKSVSDEAIAHISRSPDGSSSSNKSPQPPEIKPDSPRSPQSQRPPSPADLVEKTNQWVSSLPDSPPISPAPEDSISTTPSLALSSSPPSTHGIMLPRRKPDAFLENRRQSLNLVVVYGSDEEAEFKPTRTRDHFEKRRTDTFPFGRVFQALKLKLSSPSLVINENDIELEGQLL